MTMSYDEKGERGKQQHQGRVSEWRAMYNDQAVPGYMNLAHLISLSPM
jgi:hypothetical protein